MHSFVPSQTDRSRRRDRQADRQRESVCVTVRAYMTDANDDDDVLVTRKIKGMKRSTTRTKTKTSRLNILWGRKKVKERREHRVKKEKGKVRSPFPIPIHFHFHTRKNSIYLSSIHPPIHAPSLRLTPPSTPHPPKKSLLVILPVFLLTSHRHQTRSRRSRTTNRQRPHTLLQRIRRRRY